MRDRASHGEAAVMKKILASLLGFAIALSLLVWFLNLRDESPITDDAAASTAASSQVISRGEYLTRAGNCMGCHTARGGARFAGGQPIATPFGTVYSTNLTADEQTGIGSWSSAHFWRALHNGRSKDGRLLYPAFPYPNFTRVTREDSDAIYAYLRSQPAAIQANRPHELRFPYGLQASLAIWRAAFFRPGVQAADPSHDAQWNRGAYLTRGLGHCGACHTPRNAFGAAASEREFLGAMIPTQGWYAPSLRSPEEAGVTGMDQASVAHLLQSGVAPQRWVSGPMAEVVAGSTRYLSNADAAAMASFLISLPPAAPAAVSGPTLAASRPVIASPEMLKAGAKLYEQHCQACHGMDGKGVPHAYPPLAGNRTVTMESPANLIQMTLQGGYAPTTPGNPRPFGMPPFAPLLTDAEVATVLTYVRSAWGNRAPAVGELQIRRQP